MEEILQFDLLQALIEYRGGFVYQVGWVLDKKVSAYVEPKMLDSFHCFGIEKDARLDGIENKIFISRPETYRNS